MQRSARVWLVCLTSFIFRRAFAQHKNVHRAYWHKRSGKLLVIIGTGQPPCSRGQRGETRGMNSKGLCQNSFTHFSRFETVRKSLPTRCDLQKRNTILQIWLKLVAAIIVYIFCDPTFASHFRMKRHFRWTVVHFLPLRLCHDLHDLIIFIVSIKAYHYCWSLLLCHNIVIFTII